MNKLTTISLLLVLILPLNCKTNEPKTPNNEDHQVEYNRNCQLGCENLSDIQCLDGNSVDACINSCVDMQIHTKEMDPKCWAALISCDEMEACRKN